MDKLGALAIDAFLPKFERKSLAAALKNPMDLDYRALGNAGLWCIGRLQTDADCARVLDGLASAATIGHGNAETVRKGCDDDSNQSIAPGDHHNRPWDDG